MRQRLGRMVIGLARDGRPITADFLHAGAAMTVSMLDAVKPNLLQTLENTPVLVHAVRPVVAINASRAGLAADHRTIRELSRHIGVPWPVCTTFVAGGKGAAELAEMVAEAAEEPSHFQLLYPDAATLREKIEAVALRVYGASGVEYSPAAARQIDAF